MPIDRSEFESGNILSEVEKAVISFLERNRSKAFTISELMDGTNLKANYSDFWNFILSAMGIVGFQSLLSNLVNIGKIRVNLINGTYYYMAK